MSAPIYRGGNPFISSGLRTRVPVVASASATVTIAKSQSNSIFLLDRATLTYTLPTAKVGLVFTFVGTIIATSQIVQTTQGSTFVQGIVSVAPAGTRGDFTGNGTSHTKVTLNGTTSGGAAVGSMLYVYCITTGKWQFDGQFIGSGVAVTPFS